jgi:3-oxoadipate enol-lactonase
MRVLRYDHPADDRIGPLGTALVALLDELEIDNVSFCGASLGGSVGLWLALNVPHRVERLTLVGSAAAFGPGLEARATAAQETGMAAVARTLRARLFTPGFDAIDNYTEMLARGSIERYVAGCEALAHVDFSGRLHEICAPTMIVAGAEDPPPAPDGARALRDGIPAAELSWIENAANLAFAEQPVAFNNALINHLVGGHRDVAIT